MLYPLKFLPLFKNKVWGGNKIASLGFDYSPLPNCGEMWVLSGIKDNESIVANGPLADNNLSELLEIYMGDLIGEKNYEHFGNDFPLLIKIIDANDRLSIQVHPDDNLARRRDMPNGKSEMWYVIDAQPGAQLIDGFSSPVSKEQLPSLAASGRIESHLLSVSPQQGDVFYIPAGRVHALGKGLLIAEIQQSSDCTYRIYDYNRPDTNGRLRQLHVSEALDAIDYSVVGETRSIYEYKKNETVQILNTPHFVTSIIALDKPIRKDFSSLDSFVIYFCVEGISAIKALDSIEPIHSGECILLPATTDSVELFSQGSAKLLEIYIDPNQYVGPNRSEELDWLAQFMGDNQNPNDTDHSDPLDLFHISANHDN